MTNIEAKLIQAGVKNLREFGYEHVDSENILTDVVYSAFFRNMLKENKGLGFDKEIENVEAMLPKEDRE